MNAVEVLRVRTARFMGLYIMAHLPLVVALEWLVRGSVGWLSAVMAAIAAFAGFMAFQSSSAAQRLLLSIAMMLTVSCILGAMEGHLWQMDIHMYFFAALAMVVAFCDWRPIMAATVTVALHHLILNFVLPALVFPGGGRAWPRRAACRDRADRSRRPDHGRPLSDPVIDRTPNRP